MPSSTEAVGLIVSDSFSHGVLTNEVSLFSQDRVFSDGWVNVYIFMVPPYLE